MAQESEWKRSSFGNDDEIHVRVKTTKGYIFLSTKDSTTTVAITLEAWKSFVRGIKEGDFD